MADAADPRAARDEGDAAPLSPGRPAWSGIPWRRLLGYVRPHLGAFAVAVAALLVGLVAGLLMPLAIGEVVSLVLAGDAAGNCDRRSGRLPERDADLFDEIDRLLER